MCLMSRHRARLRRGAAVCGAATCGRAVPRLLGGGRGHAREGHVALAAPHSAGARGGPHHARPPRRYAIGLRRPGVVALE